MPLIVWAVWRLFLAYMPMRSKPIEWVCVALIAFCSLSVLLLAASFAIDPLQQRISLAADFHISLLRGRVCFFNDAEYGPYCGSIIGIVDEDGNTYPPLEREIAWGDSWGVYYRYFRWADSKLWTLMVSLWWPIVVFGLPAVVCSGIWWRRRFQRLRSCRIQQAT